MAEPEQRCSRCNTLLSISNLAPWVQCVVCTGWNYVSTKRRVTMAQYLHKNR